MFVTNLKSAAKCFRWYPRLLSADVVLHIMAFDFLWTIDSRCSGILSWWKVLDERSRRHVQNASYALYFCTFISIVHLNYPSSYGCKYFHVIFSYLRCSTRSYIKICGIGHCDIKTFSFCFKASLAWCLYGVSLEDVTLPLANFSMTLPSEWGMPLGWSLTLIPILLTIIGLLWHLCGKKLLGSLGIPFKLVC